MNVTDEQRLMVALLAHPDWDATPAPPDDAASVFPRDVIQHLGLAPKAAWRTLEKWDDKGWYESGVCFDLGWLTPEGRAKAEATYSDFGAAPQNIGTPPVWGEIRVGVKGHER